MSVETTLTQGQNVVSTEKTRELSQGKLHAKGYELVSELGTGTYGVVWLAKDSRTGVMVAIKFFARGTGEQWLSLQEEVKQLAQLHAAPNIVRLMDVEAETWPPYYVMDYAEKGSLSARLKQGPMSVGEAVEKFRQMAEALAYVHAKGILHCDLKPGNILLDATGRALVADFGQAHMASDTSPALGTFFYMAPEQADLTQQYPDTRWDVYAMGAILYAMLTGRPPREDSTLKQELENTAELTHRLTIYQQKVRISAQPVGHRLVAGVDRSLVEIVDRCLELDPEKRFRDAQAVLNALRRRDRRKRQRSLVAFGLLLPVVLVLLMSLSAWMFTTQIVNDTQSALVKEVTRADLLQAKMTANDVSAFLTSFFGEQLDLLESHARDPEFLRLINEGRAKGWSDQKLMEFMDQQGKKRLLIQSGKLEIVRWSFTDATGIMRAAAPFTADVTKIVGKQFSWRDWYNGTGDQDRNSPKTFAPIRARHVSQPYYGTTRKAQISISIPVWAGEAPAAGDNRPPLGVMMLSVKLEDFREGIRRMEPADGLIVSLFDDEWKCLYRTSKKPEVEKWWPQEGTSPPSWPCPFYEQCRTKGHWQTESGGYDDPIDHKTYLAASAPVPMIDGIVIVQRERDSVMKSGDDFREQVQRRTLWGALAACLFVPGAWGFLLWIIRREEQADG